MAGLVYFGTKDKQSWIKAPRTGLKASNENWSTEVQLLNGRAFVKRSGASHRRFEAAWSGSYNSTDEASLQQIVNYASGLYGEGPFYFVDPFSVNQNVLPMHWSAPMLAEKDWPALTSDIVPSFTSATVANNYPMKYATYETTDAYESTRKLTLIVPSGYRLHFGWHGPVTGSSTGIRIVPYLRSTGLADTALNPAKITAGGLLRTNTAINGSTYSRVEIFIATTLASSVEITGMIAQILVDTASVESGGFISGKGTTGLEFSSIPDIDYYSSEVNSGYIGMAATWTEV